MSFWFTEKYVDDFDSGGWFNPMYLHFIYVVDIELKLWWTLSLQEVQLKHIDEVK